MSKTDVFGIALLDYFRGRKQYRFRTRLKDGSLSDDPIEPYLDTTLSSGEMEALSLAERKVLDVGCGAGKHALFLQKKGMEVTALDISPAAIRVCQMRSLRKCVVGSAIHPPFRQRSFDTILLLGNGFGIGGTSENTRKMLKRLRDITKEGGKLIATCQTVQRNSLWFQKGGLVKDGSDGYRAIMRHEYGNIIGTWFNWFLASPEQMEQLCCDAGWILQFFRHLERQGYIGVFSA